jgi:hypothetical protein
MVRSRWALSDQESLAMPSLKPAVAAREAGGIEEHLEEARRLLRQIEAQA